MAGKKEKNRARPAEILAAAVVAIIMAVAGGLAVFCQHVRRWRKEWVLDHGVEPRVRTLLPPRNVDFSNRVNLFWFTTRVPKQWAYRVISAPLRANGRYHYSGISRLIVRAPYHGRLVRLKLYMPGLEPPAWASKARRRFGLSRVYKRFFNSAAAFRRHFGSDLAMWLAIVNNRNSQDPSWGFGTQWRISATCLLEKVTHVGWRRPYVYKNLNGLTIIFAAGALGAGRRIAVDGYVLGWFSPAGRLITTQIPRAFEAKGVPVSVVMRLLAILFAHADPKAPPRGLVYG